MDRLPPIIIAEAVTSADPLMLVSTRLDGTGAVNFMKQLKNKASLVSKKKEMPEFGASVRLKIATSFNHGQGLHFRKFWRNPK